MKKREPEHVFFPGMYTSRVLNDLDRLYRDGPIISIDLRTGFRKISDSRQIARGLTSIDDDDHGLTLLPADIGAARRARKACLRAVDAEDARRASQLVDRLIGILEKAREFADHDDALSRRRSNAMLATSRPRGRPSRQADQIRKLAQSYPADHNRASKIAARLGCSAAYVRNVLKATTKKNATR